MEIEAHPTDQLTVIVVIDRTGATIGHGFLAARIRDTGTRMICATKTCDLPAALSRLLTA